MMTTLNLHPRDAHVNHKLKQEDGHSTMRYRKPRAKTKHETRMNRDVNSHVPQEETQVRIHVTALHAHMMQRVRYLSSNFAHEKALGLTGAKFSNNRVEIKVMMIPAELLSKSLDNDFVGQMPKRVVFRMVENKAYNDGRQIPSRPIEYDFDENIHYAQEFHTLLSKTSFNFIDEDFGLNICNSTRKHAIGV
ncbi:hypothetical protein B566_EDAN016191 [Ephemera danica]|nr:hypothetical protein B566_EDAN016191 [Ephemera danica]